MRQLQELLKKSKFIQQLKGGRMDRISPEVAEEICVFFQHSDWKSGAGQQKTQHDACGTTADNTGVLHSSGSSKSGHVAARREALLHRMLNRERRLSDGDPHL